MTTIEQFTVHAATLLATCLRDSRSRRKRAAASEAFLAAITAAAQDLAGTMAAGTTRAADDAIGRFREQLEAERGAADGVIGNLIAEADRLRRAFEEAWAGRNELHDRLQAARQALTGDGYFTAGQVGDDIAPRITELASALRAGLAIEKDISAKLIDDLSAVREERDELAGRGVLLPKERDLVLEDLGKLLTVLGLGDHARPESPHDVFGMCLEEAGRLKGDLAAVRAAEVETGLDEAAIRADERNRVRQARAAATPADGPLTTAIVDAGGHLHTVLAPRPEPGHPHIHATDADADTCCEPGCPGYAPRPEPVPDRCPRCQSPDPAKHPATAADGGEVQPCPHTWHLLPPGPAPEPAPARATPARAPRKPPRTGGGKAQP